jgi:hypothetical protein
METVIADIAFLVATVIASLQKAWAIAFAAGGLFLLYIHEAIKGV